MKYVHSDDYMSFGNKKPIGLWAWSYERTFFHYGMSILNSPEQVSLLVGRLLTSSITNLFTHLLFAHLLSLLITNGLP